MMRESIYSLLCHNRQRNVIAMSIPNFENTSKILTHKPVVQCAGCNQGKPQGASSSCLGAAALLHFVLFVAIYKNPEHSIDVPYGVSTPSVSRCELLRRNPITFTNNTIASSV